MTIDWGAVQTAEDKTQARAAADRAHARAEARRYLAETDWYVIRAADTGTSVPETIRTDRAAARDMLSSDDRMM